jgi:hypothetical protein
MHPPEIKQAALDLIAAGHNDCEVSRRLGVPRRTILDWRRPTYVRRSAEICPRCWGATRPIRTTDADYAELLGLYLGDGCISDHPRTQHLRITLDLRYPGVIESSRDLLRRVFPRNQVQVFDRRGQRCCDVSVYSSHLTCLFPQHGPGKKHERPITLEFWQELALANAPWSFIRGAIWSDGCAFVNRTGPYEYLSYQFSNRSEDIARLVAGSCEQVSVEARLTHNRRRDLWELRVNRRASVGLMLANLGLKA